MAVWALLSISQTVKAADVTVYFQCPDGWTTPVHVYAYGNGTISDWDKTPECTKFYTSKGVELWRYTFDSKYTKVIFQDGNRQGQTAAAGFDVNDNHVYTSADDQGTLSEFEKKAPYTYTLRGGYGESEWSNESSNFVYDGTSKYTYTFTAVQTGDFRFRVNTNYKKEKNEDPVIALCPDGTGEVKSQALTNEPVDVSYTNKKNASGALINANNYWTYNVTNGKEYTFTLSEVYNSEDNTYSRKLSVVAEKTIQLLNAGTAVTGSNGKYILDLSGEASTDATITLSIDGTSYGLTTAQTISTVGTTTGIAFTTEGIEKLTLKAGLIYSLTVTEDGKMTVEAKEKVNPYKVAGAGFYLVGDFMSPYNHSDVTPGGDTPGTINYERLYFKFEQQKDGSYKIDIPACLTVKMQILGISVDGVPRVYGPAEVKELYGAKDHGTASPVTDGSVGGNSETDNLVVVDGFNDQINYWKLVTRNDGVTDDDGAYEVSLKYDPKTQSPTTWTIKHNSLKRVMYLLSNAQGATAQPLYDSRSDIPSGYSDNASASAVHLEGITNKYYVLGTVVRNLTDSEVLRQASKADDGIHKISDDKGGKQCGTHTKFFFLGADPEYESDNTTIVTKSSYQLTANKPAVAISKLKGNKIVQVNPTKGRDYESREDDRYGMQAEIQVPNANQIDYPDAISMVGPAIPSTTTTNVDGTTKWLWDATAGDMTYDESDHCYKLVLNTSADLYGKTFRFVGDHAITQNWYEDGTPANVKYPDEKVEGTSDATVADPNVVNYTFDCTENTIEHDKDIKWNRGAGLWTVRFYIIPGKDKNTFQYTITGASKIYIPVIAHMGKLLRTYTSAIDVVPVDKEVLVYAAQSYTKNKENNTGSGDETGTVKLYRLKFIPANQGVVLYAPTTLGNEKPGLIEVVPAYSATVKRYSSEVFDYVEDWAKPETKKEQIWVNQETHEQEKDVWNNYLVPVLTDTKITQFYFDDQNKWTGRNFAFTRYSQTNTGRAKGVIKDDTINEDPAKRDYFSFFRGAGTVKASYSYLMLPRTIMEGNGQILDQNQDNDTKRFSKSMVWFEGIDAPMDNETTGISELKNNVSNTDAAYYTLQGVKVAKPVKGIYIHQGKKVIIK